MINDNYEKVVVIDIVTLLFIYIYIYKTRITWIQSSGGLITIGAPLKVVVHPKFLAYCWYPKFRIIRDVTRNVMDCVMAIANVANFPCYFHNNLYNHS